jgi:type III pantothenate kinase
MLLAVDIGNTNTVFGLFAGSELRLEWRAETRVERTGDEYAALLRGLFDLSGIRLEEVTAGIISSVVPPATSPIERFFNRYLKLTPLVVGPGMKTGMPILYENPREVGADRIVNAVAAYARFPQGAVVVDFGTATTFDVVTRKGEYVGGVICTGAGISAEALFQRAARLPRVDIRRPARVIGRSTVASIQSGLYFGYAVMVEGMLARIRAELGEPARAVATGGLAQTLAADLPSIDAVDPVLTLTGLRLIWERKQAPGRP